VLALLLALWGCSSTQVDYVDVDKSTPAENMAVLFVPDYLEIYSLDNQVIEAYYAKVLFNGARIVHIAPGTHVVVLRYNDIWNTDEDDRDHERIRSRYIDLAFTAVSGGSYRIELDEPDNLDEARALAADFKAWIVDKRTGKTVSE
jgi:hypothetical protein